jgi:hypothetical protein
VRSIIEDRSGNLWFGTELGGVTRYDGVNWLTFTTADGLADNIVLSILEGRSGNLWFGTYGGVGRYDGVSWCMFTTVDGLAANSVQSIVEDRSGDLWFGTAGGITRYEPDRIPPRTAFLSRPYPVSASTAQVIRFTGAFRDVSGVTFAWSFDGSPWTDWSPAGLWTATDLCDGEHKLEVKARDYMGNLEAPPAVCVFEIDATPPGPIIVSPTFGQAIRDTFAIVGSALDQRFKHYSVDFRPSGTSGWVSLAESVNPVGRGTLAAWNTTLMPDGNYDVQLSVTDTLGLTGTALVEVTVDNQAPWADETSPALISSSGGEIYTTQREVHMYFPPHAFARDAVVTISALADSLVPEELPGGARRALSGCEVSWGGVALEKPATLDISFAGLELTGPAAGLAFYWLGADSTWHRVGGTADTETERISAVIPGAGRYGVFEDTPASAAAADIHGLAQFTLTPRVFSPQGAFGDREVSIGFSLGKPTPVTVRVFNRAGRLVRTVMSGQEMNAGANLVRWDGQDGDAGAVPAGLYLITIEALGDTKSQSVSIVR